MYILDQIGYYGPILLGLNTLFLLWNKKTWLIAYIIGFFINIIINIILKILIKDPRPKEDLAIFYATLNKANHPYNKFDMPSGHSQETIYSAVYIWFATKNIWITFAYLIVSCLTIYQRFKSEQHNILQLIIGALIGGIVAYFFAIYVKRLIPGIIKSKIDDNGSS